MNVVASECCTCRLLQASLDLRTCRTTFHFRSYQNHTDDDVDDDDNGIHESRAGADTGADTGASDRWRQV